MAMTRQARSRIRGLHGPWRTRLPLGLVLGSLVAIALVPVLVGRSIERSRSTILNVAEPARGLVTEIQLALALETGGVRGFLLTGDGEFAARYRNARTSRRQAHERLRTLADQLGAEVVEATAALAERFRAVDERVDALLDGRLSRRTYQEQLGEQQQRLETIAADAARLDETIARVAAARGAEIRAAERVGAVVTAFLVLLALSAAALVFQLGRSYHALALRLHDSEERSRQIAENIHEFVWLSDPQFTTHFYANAAYERIWGRSLESLYQDPMSLVGGVHQDDRAKVSAALAVLWRADYDIEFRVVRPDGDVRWVWSRGFPVRNDRGEVYRIAGITEDITERKRAERERQLLHDRERAAREEAEDARAAAERRRDELQRMTESRTRLVRGFTHDVTNPLGAADGFLALLEDGLHGELSAKQKTSIGKVRRSVRTALELIRHVLDIARAEAGQLQTVRVATDMTALAGEVADEFRAQAENARLTLTVQLSDVPVIASDPGRVRQVLANLVSNAVKYTPEGGHVTVSVATRSDGPDQLRGEWVLAEVRDTGPGIAPDKQAMLFLEFTRFDPGAAHGAGIGLAISQRVAHALGGAITVESQVAAGSTFTLWLPRVPANVPHAPAAATGIG